jgi:hypothetical protein
MAAGLLMPGHSPDHVAVHRASVAAPAGNGPVKRGAALGSSPTVALADVLKSPGDYTARSIMLEGVVKAVCTRKGCWMEIAATKGARGLRVTFKDYGFFVPTTSKGMKVRAEGHVVVETMSKEDVDHYVSEGASVDRNPDGTATEVRFVADGVELVKGR